MDPELTEIGRQQAEHLALFIKNSGHAPPPIAWDPQNRGGFILTHLYTSLMVRSVATGAILSRYLELPLLAWPDWHEGGGIYLEDEQTGEKIGYPGKDAAYLNENYPSLVLRPGIAEKGWWNQPFEERPQRWERARRVVDELLLRHAETDDRVAVVSHGGFFNYFIDTLLCLEQTEKIWFLLNNCSISRFDFEEKELRLTYMNRVDYLPPHLVT